MAEGRELGAEGRLRGPEGEGTMQGRTPAGSTASRELDRRRSGRIYLTVPVVVTWKAEDGETQEAQGTTEELNSIGGLLRIRRTPPESVELVITHSPSGESIGAHVIRIEDHHQDGLPRVAFHYKSQTFSLWGVTFPGAKVQ